MSISEHRDWPAFLAAISANPDDDSLRLVAADFLEENGDPDRAMFIRIQVELARLETIGLGKSPEVDHLRRKERAFLGPLSVFRSLWAAEACPELVRIGSRSHSLDAPGSMTVEGAETIFFRRGFVEGVACSAEQWLQHARAIRSRNPVQRLLLFSVHLDRGDWWVLLPLLRGLRLLILAESGFDPGTAERVAWLQSQLPGIPVLTFPQRSSAMIELFRAVPTPHR